MTLTAATEDRYRSNRWTLVFADAEIERAYAAQVIERTILYCRIGWVLVIVLVAAFGLLDQAQFGATAETARSFRVALLAFAGLMFVLTFVPAARVLTAASAAIMIVALGLFSVALSGLDDPALFSPYVAGLYLAFACVFLTPGLGLARSVLAMVVSVVAFELVIGLVVPVPGELLAVYNFFLVGSVVVFSYAGYLVDRTARDAYVFSTQLSESLAQVRQLSGLLPICSACKKIRDDQGYWNRIETFIANHSEADFTHGICPDCAGELYPELGLEEAE